MSQKFPGGFITKSPVAPTSTAASGVWTLDQQQQYQKAGTWPSPPIFIEDLFSTYLYTGTGAAQTITNGIDLSGQGGLVWFKGRNTASNNRLYDTARGMTAAVGGAPYLYSNDTAGNLGTGFAGTVVATSSGFDITQGGIGDISDNGSTYASWTFRESPKFFDVVTYTGNGTNGRTVAHSLGSTPGCIIVKRTDAANGWAVYHRAMNASPQDYMMRLNATDAAFTTSPSRWNNTLPTSTEFTLSGNDEVNGSGATYVAYLFAHNAGGFPASGAGSTNGISCGSFTTDGSGNATIDLGYEPQWLLIKSSSSVNDWTVVDNMRGWVANGGYADLNPNLSAAEDNFLVETFLPLNATGFKAQFTSGNASKTYIYIAIRRGPMKTPTTGTSVFTPVQNSNFTAGVVIAGQPTVDMFFNRQKDGSNYTRLFDRLRGSFGSTCPALYTNTDDAETNTVLWALDQQNGVRITQTVGTYNYVNYFFSRAPQFFDEVCYTGNGTAGATQNHNLGVVPELVILKCRSAIQEWRVMSAYYNGGVDPWSYRMALSTTGGVSAGSGVFNDTAPTASVFTLGNNAEVNDNGSTYVAYLFATCAGVSKVGNYTGTGTTKQIDCGFTGGARFVLIKRTDSTGDWYYWDSSRGIVAGNDPYLLINSMAAEVTNTDYIDTYSAGFEISSTAPAAINANGGTYIFLAIA